MNTKIKSIIGIAALTVALNASAQSVYTGLRGPTDFQLDDRVSLTHKETQTGKISYTKANNSILKYWNGTDKGVFAYANVPVKSIESEGDKSEGLGDIAVGVGPRFDVKVGEGKLGLLSYVGPVFNTGDVKEKPALGTGRTDYKTGLFGTLVDGAKKYEADFSLDYTLTEGSKVSDEINGGIVLGGRLNNNFRGVAGIVANYKSNGDNDGDNSISGRVNIRYTPNGALGKKMHFELWYDRFLSGTGKSAPSESDAVTLVGRFNLGK